VKALAGRGGSGGEGGALSPCKKGSPEGLAPLEKAYRKAVRI